MIDDIYFLFILNVNIKIKYKDEKLKIIIAIVVTKQKIKTYLFYKMILCVSVKGWGEGLISHYSLN